MFIRNERRQNPLSDGRRGRPSARREYTPLSPERHCGQAVLQWSPASIRFVADECRTVRAVTRFVISLYCTTNPKATSPRRLKIHRSSRSAATLPRKPSGGSVRRSPASTLIPTNARETAEWCSSSANRRLTAMPPVSPRSVRIRTPHVHAETHQGRVRCRATCGNGGP